jgi:hypothetical protein
LWLLAVINPQKSRAHTAPSRLEATALSARQKLSNRRLAETFNFQCNGLDYVATVGRFDNGDVAEIF